MGDWKTGTTPNIEKPKARKGISKRYKQVAFRKEEDDVEGFSNMNGY